MALSGREVMLVLRARDEATRTISRVSGAMRRMDRDAISSDAAMTASQRKQLTGLTSQLGQVNRAYAETTAASLHRHRSEMNQTGEQLIMLRKYEDAVRRQAADQTRLAGDQLRTSRITRATYDQQMRDIRNTRDMNLRALTDQRREIEAVRLASTRTHQAQMEHASALRRAQQNNITAMREQINTSIAQRQEVLAHRKAERAMLRDRGMMITGMSAGAIAGGVSMIYMGTQGVRAYANITKAAIDYEQQARKTLTQVDVAGGSLQKIVNIGKQVADTVPVAFEEIQPALYDIFSSIDTNVNQSRGLLKQFAKDAVAGQTTMETATRANLQLMNAYKVEVKDAADVSDFMFQLVRKGVGSYDEFAKSIGRAIPSARRAGQSYQTLGAMMAFLTRNGLSTAMAATSSARALDAMAHPETVKRLEEMGVNVKDAKGEFLPLVGILDDMNKQFGEMTGPERSKALYELFKSSGGTIQARRFFDNYFKNAEEFNKRTKEMGEYAGEAGNAFKKMANSPQAELQRLQNQWMLLRIELGNVFMPIAMKIVDVIRGWIEWFRRLSPETQETILKIGALVVAIGLVGGALSIMLGFVGMAIGGLNMLGIKAGTAIGKMGLIGAAVAIGAKSLGKLSAESSTAEKAVGILGTTASGALAGFAVGGPIGAAIGGGIGLLGGLGTAIWNAGNKMDEGEAAAARYAEGIDKIAAASGRAQRAEALRFLQQEGMLGVANNLGIETNTLVHALLGNKDAIKRVTGGWKDYQNVASGIERQKLHKFITEQGWALKNAKQKMDEAEEGLKKYQKAGEKIPPMTEKVRNALKKLGNVKPNNEFVDFFTKGLKRGVDSAGKAKDDANKHLKNIGKLRVSSHWLDLFKNDLGKGKQDATLGGLAISDNLKKGTSKAKADLNPFMQALRTGINTARSSAASGGTSIGNALGSGVYTSLGSWMGSVIGRAASMVSQAVAAAKREGKIKSPSKETEYIGKMLAEGLAKGIKDNSKKPKKEMSDLVKRIMKELTRDMRADMPKLGAIMDLSKQLLDNQRGKLKKKQRASLLKNVQEETAKDLKRLQGIVKKYREVAKKLDDARDRLRTLREEQRSYQQSVKGAIESYGSFSSFGTPQDVFGNQEDVSLEFIKSNISSRLGVIREYGQNLKKLLAMGYSKAVYDMVVQMGPEQGNEYAKALIAATPKDVKEINQGIAQITDQASKISTAAGSAMYDAGIKAAEGLVAGLEKRRRELERVAKDLGQLIAQTIRKELGIKSPSKVGIKIGANFGRSIARGMSEQGKTVSRASTVLARAAQFDMNATSGTSRPFTPVVSGQGSPGVTGKQIHQEITVNTQEIDPRAHAAMLGWELANRG